MNDQPKPVNDPQADAGYDPPKPTTGEWTAVTVNSFMSGLESQTKNPYQVIADAHNAALAAERERFMQAYRDATAKALADIQPQLLAEREKAQPLVDALHRLAMRVLQSDFYPQAKQETDDALLLARLNQNTGLDWIGRGDQ